MNAKTMGQGQTGAVVVDRNRQPPWFSSRRGFTLIEVLIATALLGFSLVVMFGFHAQASRSNLHARKITDCTYLAQDQMEELLSLQWDTSSPRPTDLVDLASDTTGPGDAWAWLGHPDSGAQPTAINSAGNTDTTYGEPTYYVTWDVSDMDAEATWMRIRVRCVYRDNRFNTWRGTTISSFKYRDS